jgi:5,10-methylenetetrahydromethanopterin reductase
MRLGLALWPDRHAAELAELAVAAEAAGFDDLWWPDHYDARECSAVLALCATRTTRIRLGTAVTSVLLRHPGVLASMFATLNELSGGRAVAGLGPGGFEVKTNLRVRAASPVTAVRESVEILRGLLAGGQVSIPGGRQFPVQGARLAFPAGGDVPVYLAGRGPRMLELSGEVADGVITHGLARPYLDLARQSVAAGAARSGRDPAACEVALMFEVALDEDLARARDALRPRCLYMVGGEYAEELIPLYGLDPVDVQPVRAALRAGDPGAVGMIDDRMVDAFCIAGPAGRVADGMAALAEGGIESFIVTPGKGVDARVILQLGKATREVVR